MVTGEIIRHLTEKAAEAQQTLHAAVRHIKTHWHRDTDAVAVMASLGINCAAAEFATRYFDDYVKLTGAEIISADNRVTHEEIRHRYFANQRPFSTAKAKKDEFPDALALLSLEHWAQQNDTIMLVISHDGDWKAFCELSKHLICAPKLDQALGYFNRDFGFVVARAVALLRANEAPEFHRAIGQAVERYFEDFDPDIEASANAYYELDVLEATVQGWDINELYEQTAVNSDDEVVAFSMHVEVTADIEATFDFQVWDGVDKEYMPLGSGTAKTEASVDLELVITIGRETDPEPDVYQIDVQPRSITLDFGQIEPDW